MARRQPSPPEPVPGLRPGLLTTEELLHVVRSRLLAGWVLVVGDTEAIGRLERDVYPPVAAANEDFELILLPTASGILSLFLARNTEALRRFLERAGAWTPEEIRRMVLLEFGPLEGLHAPVRAEWPMEMSREEWVSRAVDALVIATRRWPRPGKLGGQEQD